LVYRKIIFKFKYNNALKKNNKSGCIVVIHNKLELETGVKNDIFALPPPDYAYMTILAGL